MFLVIAVGKFQVVVEADNVERVRHTLCVVTIHRRRHHARRIEFVAQPHHIGADARTLLGHRPLHLALLVADRPQDDRRRIAIAFHHCFQLRHPLWIRTHLPRLAHHHHAHAIAGFHPFRRGHIVRSAHRIAAHLAQHGKPEPLQRIRHRRTHSGMILVIAGALNLHRLAIQKESLVCGELCGAHTKAHALGIARLPPASTVTIA